MNYHSNNSFQDTTIELTAAYLIYSGPQHDIYSRPYEGHATAEDFNNAMIATNGGTSFLAESLVDVASSIIYPAYTPDQLINISNGMGEARFAFFLEITIKSIHGTEREIIKGYTNYLGCTQSGTLDPNMEFFFNDRILIGEFDKIGAGGGYTDRRLKHNFKILSTNMNQFPNGVSMRPEDVISWKQNEMAGYSDIPFLDTRVMLGNQPQQANAMFHLPNHYLSEIITGYANSSAMLSEGYELYGSKYHEKAYESTKTSTLLMSKFYNKVMEHKQTVDNKVTLGELDRIWPRAREFWQTVMPKPGGRHIDPLMYANHWHGANMETQLAVTLSQIVPALMTELMIKSLDVTLTNMTLGNKSIIQVLNYTELFDNTVTPATISYITSQIEFNVVRGLLLSRPDIMSYDIQMSIQLIANSQFNISINGGIKTPYNVPTFCNSLYSSMMGTSTAQLSTITEFVGGIVDSLVEENSKRRFNKVSVPTNGYMPPVDTLPSFY